MSLREKYLKEVVPALAKEFGIDNPMAVPKITKVVVSMGTGETLRDKGVAEKIKSELALITGLKPQVMPAKVSVASFGIRAGMPVGLRVTLRRDKMYDFLEKLINVVLPRLRDFRGVPRGSFDGRGNYTLGIVEHTVFPEVDLSQADKTRGMGISIVTNTNDIEQSRRLLELIGMPFEKEQESERVKR